VNRTQRFVMRIPVLLALLSLCTLPTSHAGDDWLPIPATDLTLKDNPASPGARAMILYRESDVDSKESSVKEYVRIKIFTQEGTSEGDIEIPFFKGNSEIKDIRGRTIQPDGTITKFDGKIFEKVVVKASGFKFLAKTFTMPDVHPGCVIEFKYREQSDPNFLYNQKWTVSRDLFTRDARFSFKPYTGPGAVPFTYRQFGLPADAVPLLQKDGSYQMDIHNIAAIEEEGFMPPEKVLETRVEFYYRSFDDPNNESEQHYWNRIAKGWSDGLDHFVSKKGVLDDDLRGTISPNDAPQLKLEKIYVRVQKIRNLSFEDLKSAKEQKQEQLKPNSNVEDVLKRNYGNGREINYTFVGLARAAGFEATEIFVAPRNNNFFFPQMKDSGEIPADVVWVRAGSKEYYLDPAAASYPFGIIPWYETDTQGIRISKQGAEMVKTPASAVSDANITRHAEMEINDDGLATGKLRVTFTGQAASLWREDNRKEDETGRRKAMEDQIKGWLPAGSAFDLETITNWDKNSLPLQVEGVVRISNLGTIVGRRMLVPAAVFRSAEGKVFQSQKRINPIYFPYPFEEIDSVTLHTAAGYHIETVPNANQLNPGVVSYEISARQQGDSVEVKRHLVVNGIWFPVKSYPALRHFFNNVETNDDAQIVFQNSESAKIN
jgi:hypothetical protein